MATAITLTNSELNPTCLQKLAVSKAAEPVDINTWSLRRIIARTQVGCGAHSVVQLGMRMRSQPLS